MRLPMIFFIMILQKKIATLILTTILMILLKILIPRKLGVMEMVLCIQAIVIGVVGGAVSFYTAIKYIQ